MRVRVLSRNEVEDGGAEGADAVISILDSSASHRSQVATAVAQAIKGESARLLKLSFDDIGTSNHRNLIGPSMDQVAEAIAFTREIKDGHHLFDGAKLNPLIVINCESGCSRSAAIALAVLADHFGDGSEYQAVSQVLRADVDDRMCPNPLIVNFADSYLLRYGKIDKALAALSPRYVLRRTLWSDSQRKAYGPNLA